MSNPPWKDEPFDFEPLGPPSAKVLTEPGIKPKLRFGVNPNVRFEKFEGPDGRVEVYTNDLHWMLCEAADYCRETGDQLLCCDNPLQRQLGYCSVKKPGVAWKISFSNLRRSFSWMKQEVARLDEAGKVEKDPVKAEKAEKLERMLEIYQTCVLTFDGRAHIASTISASSNWPSDGVG
jgi:hypothetical protein